MNLGYENSVAVVTGGTSGIGLATVRVLLRAGARVALCARNESRMEDVRTLLVRDHGEDKIIARALSVLDEDAVNDFAKQVQTAWGQCDLLVNNAGQGRQSTFANTENDDWREEYELKLSVRFSPFALFCRCCAKPRARLSR